MELEEEEDETDLFFRRSNIHVIGYTCTSKPFKARFNYTA